MGLVSNTLHFGSGWSFGHFGFGQYKQLCTQN